MQSPVSWEAAIPTAAGRANTLAYQPTRSPYDPKYGLPHRPVPAPRLVYVNGKPTIAGTILTSYGQTAPDAVRSPSYPLSDSKSQPNYTPGIYGNEIGFSLVFAAAGELIALRRPNQTRIELLIQNLSVAAGIFYAFDRQADANSCILVGQGGNRLWDGVCPQGDLHIFASGAGTVAITYINQNIVNPANV